MVQRFAFEQPDVCQIQGNLTAHLCFMVASKCMMYMVPHYSD